MIVGFSLFEKSRVVKDTWISILPMDGEICGCFSKKHPWSADLKLPNRSGIGERGSKGL